MANSYTHMTARKEIPCSEEDFERLTEEVEQDRIRADEEDESGSDLEVTLYEGMLHARTDYGSFDADAIGEGVLRVLGAIIQKTGEPYWLWDYANTCDKLRPGSHGGGSLRIMPDGTIEWPTVAWVGNYKHYIVSGRIPGDDEDTTLYLKVPKTQTEIRHAMEAYIRKLYFRRDRSEDLPDEVVDAEGYVNVRPDGECWAIINSMVEIPGEPLYFDAT